MAKRTRPPFRADHVGSLLRPQRLIDARQRREAGAIEADELRAVEDDCIREAVKLQEDVGLTGITDGEFRRTNWSSDFLTSIGGVDFGQSKVRASFHRADGTDLQRNVTSLSVSGRMSRPDGIQTRDFAFLQSVTGRTPKVSIPSPSMLHFRGGRDAIDPAAYPEMEDFFADLTGIYNAEVMDLAALGARYIQFDDTNFAYLCDPKLREASVKAGHDPNDLPRLYCRLINDSIRGKPDDMAVCVHMCRGNFKSSWIAEGGYEPVAEVLFSDIEADGIFMEYDDERSGDFAPLRLRAQGQDRGARHRHLEKAGAREQGRPQAAHRRGGPIRRHRPACHQPAMRLFLHRRRQRADRRGRNRQAAAGGRNRGRDLGRCLRRGGRTRPRCRWHDAPIATGTRMTRS